MDKITRIHLAKVPYDIEINAQVALQDYLHEIRQELDSDLADEIMSDIEVRITEILSDRNIKRDDVITIKDIDAVMEQLGSPEQFTDGQTKGKSKHHGNIETKTLLRDIDGAYIGGVASGLGAYFAIDPIFIRIIFIALTFVSGLGIVLYIVLWLLVPAAKTSSDKLRMRGEPVTAIALQRYRSTAQRTIVNLKLKSLLKLCYKVVRVLLTIFVAVFVLALLSSIGFGSAILYTQPLHQLYAGYHLNYLLFSLIWLFAMTIVGLLIILLLRIWRQRSAPLKVVFVALASVLIVTLAGIAVVSPFVASHYKNKYGDNKLATAISVQNDTPLVAPTDLSLSGDRNLDVSYDISSQPLHATYQAYPGMGQPMLAIVNRNGTISIQANQLSEVVPNCVLNWCHGIYLPVRVTVYGPELQKFSVDSGAELDLNNVEQTNLTLTATNSSNIIINNSYSNNLNLSSQSGANIDASNTTAQVATISVQNDANVFGPASSSLKATLPAVCSGQILILAQAPATITLNGQSVTAQTFSQDNCVSVDDPTPPQAPQPANVQSVPVVNNGN